MEMESGHQGSYSDQINQEPILRLLSYNAGVVKITAQLKAWSVFMMKLIFLRSKNASLLQRWRCSCKINSRRIGEGSFINGFLRLREKLVPTRVLKNWPLGANGAGQGQFLEHGPGVKALLAFLEATAQPIPSERFS
jgi:hypothetical protein